MIVDDLEFMPPVPPTTGTTSTGKNTSMTGKTQTGAINVVVPSVVNISADMVKNITQWAYRNGLTALPLSQTQIYAATSRYNVAQMFTQFALRIQKKALVHNSLCNIQKYSDYATFTADMRTTITNICDLGLMGLGSNGKSLIATFNPSEQVTSEQLKTIINRYVPGMITTKTIVQNRNLDVLYWLVQIAVKK